jgi:hypothetical protein
MKLPNCQLASVPERKITRYLLNPAHPAGGSKAAFFLRFGFKVTQWRRLAALLLRHACENPVAEEEKILYGTRYVVDGPLHAPDGNDLNIRSVWFIDHGMELPRFVTAHPLPK